ncbi:GNAT family N-acetyltransferase [Salinisphaera sp.]|uniref:GNAT family N-acetyltransferase n=1 Tax=Salinisphaera sp. TaxID=1914330 RepID=UPI000C374C91|nr:GNAT family N-acetyltransferase [Salinisphaera sp.]MBS61718.1 hypothetical protein [Salinisphaera sp.]
MSVLRTARQDDLNALIQWIGSPQQCLYWAGPRVSYPIDKAQLAEQIEWDRADAFCLVGTQELLGFGQVMPKPRNRLHFARLIVSPSHRCQGYGLELVNALLRWALARQPKSISLNVFRDNAAAIAVYRRLGFTEAGPVKGYPRSAALHMRYKR